MNNNRIWILGASDPEMSAIETLLTECGEIVVFALGLDGLRVSPREMYRARLTTSAVADVVYEVECMIEDRASIVAPLCFTIDHHRLGDPGYGRSPAEFFQASSIGQVITALRALDRLPNGWNIPDDILFTAAADHCLGSAYAGKCPGVDPDDLMRWRVESRAKFQGADPATILAAIEAARAELAAAPQFPLQSSSHCGHGSAHYAHGSCGKGEQSYGSGHPHASTEWGTGDCYCDCGGCRTDVGSDFWVTDMRRPAPIPELVEAATRDGVAYISGPLLDTREPNQAKYTVSGEPETVRAWMETWAPAQGMTGIYGDPERGFAGGYLAI